MAHDDHDHDDHAHGQTQGHEAHDHDDHDDHDHGDHDHDHDDHDHEHDDHDHDHHHGHAHGHGHHHHGPADLGDKRYLIGIGLNLAIVVAQAIAGVIGHSTALLADASHNMSDVLGLALAGGAAWLAAKPPGARRTYGFGKATVFAALINGLLLVFASGAIVWEAVHRFMNPEPVNGGLVMATAGVGVVVNGLTAWMFMRGREGDANVRAAFLHMAGDAMISVGVIVAGLLVMLTGVSWIDPLASVVIVLVILWGTFGLLRDAADMAMDAAPRSVDIPKLRAFLAAQPGVAEVHDLHVWSMGAASCAMTAHLVMPEVADNDAFIKGLCRQIDRRFDIDHATFQIERGHFECHPDHH
jgi:cobalt-zinc-cadmium efflux system protein